MRIILTGGTGFIGAHFINKALEDGHEIIAIRRSPESKTRLALKREPIWINKNFGDVTQDEIKSGDVLVHLAAAGITPQPATWETCLAVNLNDTLNLVQTALDSGIRRVIVCGTYSEYGLSGLRYDKIPADAPLEPTDIYAASKAAAFIALSTLCRVRKFELSYQRLFSAYGEGQYENNFWPQLYRAAVSAADFPMTEGDQIRDYIEVGEVVNRLLTSCVSGKYVAGVPHVVNLASGNPVKLVDFAKDWWSRLEAKGSLLIGAVPSRPNEVKRYVPQVDD